MKICLSLFVFCIGLLLPVAVIADEIDSNLSKVQVISAQEPNSKPIIIWHHHTIRDNTQTLRTVLKSGLITHVSIGGLLSIQDCNFAQAYDRAKEAISIVKKARLPIIWVRVMWPLYNITGTKAEDIFDPNYYIKYIQMAREEVKQVNADYLAIDIEAYANTPTKKYLRGPDILTLKQIDELNRCIDEVIKKAGHIDFILPAGAMERPTQPTKYIARLGINRISETTYYDDQKFIDRIDYPYEIFGVYVNTEKKGPTSLPYYLVNEVFEKSYRWSGKKGIFIFAKEHNAQAVAGEMLKYSLMLPKKTELSH